MYTSCLICHGDLGRNEILKSTQIGQRFAFDSRNGRLWVICRRCSSWNLSPIEERWEVIDELSEAFEHTHWRYATEHVGLAELKSGVHIVRIGGPSLREFAAWRYGRRLAVRRTRAGAHAAAVGVLAGGTLAFASGLALGASALALGGYVTLFFGGSIRSNRSNIVASIPLEDAEAAVGLTREDLRYLRVARAGESIRDWRLDTQDGTHFDGQSRDQALALVLPLINRWGVSREEQNEAIRLLQERGGSEGYLASLRERNLETLWSWPRVDRFAVEMAANESVERQALEGELRLLRRAWNEADALAAIADSLLIPVPVEDRLLRLKTRRDSMRDRRATTRSNGT